MRVHECGGREREREDGEMNEWSMRGRSMNENVRGVDLKGFQLLYI